ncbi:MAG: hypothetical protein JJ714_06635 [Acidithiobacillus sp.]|nr:hypothetical protein [Acidithiobacillus sp.]
MEKKYGLFYCSTKNSFARLSSSIQKQKDFHHALEGLTLCLVTDVTVDEVPSDISDFFYSVTICNPWVVDNNGKNYFSLSRLRNAALDFADSSGFDGILFCDSDTIVARLSISNELDFCTPNVYWQREQDEPIEKSALNIISEQKPFSDANSWFYLSSSAMKDFRFNECIIGYGYEDIEFALRVESKFPLLQNTCGIVIHNYHTNEERNVDENRFAHNKRILDATTYLLRHSYSVTNQSLDVFTAVHPHWRDEIIFDFTSGIFFRIIYGDRGKFSSDGGNFILTWDDSSWPSERFILIDEELHFSNDLRSEQ